MSELGSVNLTTTNGGHFRKSSACGTDFVYNKNIKKPDMFDRSTINCAKNALDYLSSRNRVVSSNIANVNTPGYKSQDISFKDVLASKNKTRLKLMRTNAKHFPAEDESGSMIPTHYSYKGVDVNDGKNDVDLDKELLKMGEVQTNFTIFSEFLRRKYDGVNKTINETP